MNKPVRNDSGAIKYTTLSAAAQTLGKKGGKSTSPPKSAASRQNGKLGGKPSKSG